MSLTFIIEIGKASAASGVLSSAAKVLLSVYDQYLNSLTVAIQFEDLIRKADDHEGAYLQAKSSAIIVYFCSRMESVSIRAFFGFQLIIFTSARPGEMEMMAWLSSCCRRSLVVIFSLCSLSGVLTSWNVRERASASRFAHCPRRECSTRKTLTYLIPVSFQVPTPGF